MLTVIGRDALLPLLSVILLTSPALGSCASKKDEPVVVPALPGAKRMVLERETKLSKLLPAELEHFEASGVAVKNGELFIVLDNATRLAVVDIGLTTGRLGPGGNTSSAYEAITVNANGFYVVTEVGSGGTAEVTPFDDQGVAGAVQATDAAFANHNKGLEGGAWLMVGGTEYLLGLCEGNTCTADATNTGNGRIKVMALRAGSWVTETTLEVPPQAAFIDYSDLALRPRGDGSFELAVLSQRSAALWLGTLTTGPFAIGETGSLYDFPVNGDGSQQYCELEGITFLGESTFALTSDKTDDKEYCNDKDESVHVFHLP